MWTYNFVCHRSINYAVRIIMDTQTLRADYLIMLYFVKNQQTNWFKFVQGIHSSELILNAKAYFPQGGYIYSRLQVRTGVKHESWAARVV